MYRRMIHRRYRGKRYSVLSLTLGVVVAMTWLTYRYHREIYEYFLRGHAHDRQIQAAARRHGLDSALVRAVIWQESRFNANITGSSGEIGLMQIRPKHGAAAEWARVKSRELPPLAVLYHPSVNLEIGTWYLARAMRKWQGHQAQLALALSEYNAGPGGMESWTANSSEASFRELTEEDLIGRITIASTQEYVRNIVGRYHAFCQRREAEE